jgi:hypothetical protein
MGDALDVPGYFQRYPHFEVPGFMMIEPEVHSEPWTWSLRARAEWADDFNDVDRLGGHVLLSTTSRWGIESEFYRYRENVAGGGHDHLWAGDMNLLYRFAQSERVQMRVGLGCNWLHDDADTDFGFNLTYGGDWFPFKPWVVSATLDWGWLHHASLFHFRTTVGVVVWGAEVYTGYDYYDVGNTQINGLVGGVRLWF